MFVILFFLFSAKSDKPSFYLEFIIGYLVYMFIYKHFAIYSNVKIKRTATNVIIVHSKIVPTDFTDSIKNTVGITCSILKF